MKSAGVGRELVVGGASVIAVAASVVVVVVVVVVGLVMLRGEKEGGLNAF